MISAYQIKEPNRGILSPHPHRSFKFLRCAQAHRMRRTFVNINLVLLPLVVVVMAACIGAIIFGVMHLVAHSTGRMQGL
ncbi:hypothetical protein [Paraburkholderia xenovorans]|uniref:hypothetical protein n=1 Tax=Paraburkholderia xenovorans TaxID=36873 RepID=UPI0020A62114|nr:hypothetical protein [Paraburkholderia xenovorans]